MSNAIGPSLKNRWCLGGLLLAAFVVRIAAVAAITGLNSAPQSGSDESEYDAIALNVAQGNGYRGPSPDVEDPNHVTAYRPPTTPLIYAGLYAVFGHTYIPLHIVNALFATMTVLLVYGITRHYAGERAGLVAAGLYAFYPAGIYYNLTILSEVQGAFLTALFAWCCLRIKKPSGTAWSVAAGLTFGLLLLCKPGNVFLLPLLPVVGWAVFRGNVRYWARAVALTLSALLVLTPWIVRNHFAMQAFIPFGTGGGQLLASVNNRIVVEDPVLYGYSVMDNALPEYAAALAAPDDEVKRDKVAKVLAVDWLRSNPDKWFYLAQGKFRRLWTPVYYGRGDRAAAAINGVYYFSALMLFLAGFVPITKQLVRDRDPALIMHALILSTVISALVFHGQHRYRFPIDSICISMAAVAVVRLADRAATLSPGALLAEWWRNAVRHRTLAASVLVAALVLAVFWIADQRRIEGFRRETCLHKLEGVSEAVRRFESRYDRLPDELSELVPEFLPIVDSLHCPAHSIGWKEYKLLKSDDAHGKESVISYCFYSETATGRIYLTDAWPLHSGQANRLVVSH